MKDQFVPYELSLKLKSLDFDEKCMAYYRDTELYRWIHGECQFFEDQSYWINSECEIDKNCGAPLWQDIFDWFDSKELFGRTDFYVVDEKGSKYDGCKAFKFIIKGISKYKEFIIHEESFFPTELKAKKACLKQLITIYEEQF